MRCCAFQEVCPHGSRWRCGEQSMRKWNRYVDWTCLLNGMSINKPDVRKRHLIVSHARCSLLRRFTDFGKASKTIPGGQQT